MWFRGTQQHHPCISELVLVPIRFCKWWRYLWPPGLASSPAQPIRDAKGVFIPNCCCFWGADHTSGISYLEIQSESFAVFLEKMPQRIWCDPCICNVNIESMLIRVKDPSILRGPFPKAMNVHTCTENTLQPIVRSFAHTESILWFETVEVNCIWKFRASACSAPEKSQLRLYISRRPCICVENWHSRNSLEAVRCEICMHQ